MKVNVLVALNAIITVICFALYIILLVGMFFSIHFIYALAVPAAGFFICTILRLLINAPRPYEVNGVDNFLGKKTTGKSFPSRHVCSIFVISTTVFVYDLPWGIILFALGVVMAFVRVLAKVHFIKDVVAGAALGTGVGCILFFLPDIPL